MIFSFTQSFHAEEGCGDTPSDSNSAGGPGHWDYDGSANEMWLYEWVIAGEPVTGLGFQFSTVLTVDDLTLSTLASFGLEGPGTPVQILLTPTGG